jgi:hypothetical protein
MKQVSFIEQIPIVIAEFFTSENAKQSGLHYIHGNHSLSGEQRFIRLHVARPLLCYLIRLSSLQPITLAIHALMDKQNTRPDPELLIADQKSDNQVDPTA